MLGLAVALSAPSARAQAAHPAVSPHGLNQAAPPSDGVFEAPDFPPGTILVEVRDGDDKPLSGVPVTLGEAFESVAEGKHENAHNAVTGPDGVARFAALSTSLRSSFTPRVDYLGGHYALDPFRASEKQGLRVLLHVYPATSDINQSFVGMRGFVYVTLRESAIHFELLYRVFNMSRVAWVPDGVSISVPSRATGFSPKPGATRFEVDGQRLVVLGTFPPGERDLLIQFQVPSENNESELFALGVLPHVGELRVLAEAAPGVTLRVPGFEAVQRAEGPGGAPVWITRRLMNPGEGEIESVTIELAGLPVIGPERYYALFAALALAGFGVYFAVRYRKDRASRKDERERVEEAKKVLLAELDLLARARDQEVIGPQTYEATRRQIVDALARLALRRVA
jgi:hypothetical protein